MKLGSALGIPEDVFRYTPDNRLILPLTRLGLEFEFEGVRQEGAGMVALSLAKYVKEPWARYWNFKLDRSLHDAGCEYVFAEPLFGTDALIAVFSLCEYAKKNKFKVSIRTGLHVHVDVRDLTRIELARLNVLFALFERAVYRYAGNNREENVFCLPWYRSDQMQSHVHQINSDVFDVKEASSALENEKYGGLNLDTLARFGSVEFRMALATMEPEWVLAWVNICLAFKRAAQKLDVPPLALIHQLSAVGVVNFAQQVFEDQFQAINYPELEQDVWLYGVETALHVLPKAQVAIDKATLSWNRNARVENVNPRFKAFVDKAKPKQRAAAPQPAAAMINDEAWLQAAANLRPQRAHLNMDFEARPIVQDEPDDAREPGEF